VLAENGLIVNEDSRDRLLVAVREPSAWALVCWPSAPMAITARTRTQHGSRRRLNVSPMRS
jgi:hypothetical protein